MVPSRYQMKEGDKNMNIKAYKYEADYHCIECTVKRFAWWHKDNSLGRINEPVHADWWGIYEDQEDSEGNLVHPVFSTDEWQELDESFLAEHPTQYLACGDCHEIIEEYTVEGEIA